MKATKYLIPVFLVLFAVFGIGCSRGEKKNVEKVIKNELDLLKNLDSDTTQKYVSYQELFPDTPDTFGQSDSIEEVFSLFFQDFDYKILDITVNKKKQTAEASLRLSTLDARSLAADYARAALTYEITEAARTDQESSGTIVPLEDRYLILNRLLKENKYDSVEQSCTVSLTRTDKKVWEIKRTYTLENELVGGLITYLSDPDILSPEDTLAFYLKTLKKMDKDEMSGFLGIESLLTTEDSDKNAIAQALVDQVHQTFDYEILDSQVNGYKAVVRTKFTTFDSDAILSAHQKALEEYLSTPDAVIDGASKRLEISHQMLLDCIKANEATCTTEASFTLTNDGASWKLKDPGTELGNAIFGTLSSPPAEEESTEVTEE